jgi:glyoxylase-like metal-dependent hydrolase (beta-lactamase superfamily II)
VRFFIHDFGIRRAPEETAVRQVRRLGYQPDEIRHIVVSHLHFDHAGGLPDFPWAAVHLHRREYEALLQPKTWLEKYAYDQADFAHHPKWVFYKEASEEWFGFNALRLPFLPEMYLIPLFGHTSGHCGVAIREEDGWLLYAADALPVNVQYDLTPSWLNQVVIGPHVPRLRALAEAHPEVRLLAGHMWKSFFDH